MNKIKIIGLTFFMIFSSSIFAQEKSEIVMTKAELESFLEKVAEARRAQLKAKRQKKDDAYLSELRLRKKSSKNSRQRNFSNAEIIRELDRINMRLDYMSYGSTTPYSGGSNSSTLIIPSGNGGATYIPSQQQYVPTKEVVQAPNNDRKIWELEQKLAQLKEEKANQRTVIVQPKSDSIQLANLQNDFNDLKNQFNTAGKGSEKRREMLAELLAKFKNFKKQVFFANNSDQLGVEYYAYIQDVTKVLRDYPELSVILEGWASSRGNAKYNKQLSMRRAEAVEKALLSNGISSTRIVSSFRGEDTSTSEAMARRVDMSVILK